MTTVDTASLHLRPFEPGDVAAYTAIRSKREVVRWLPGGAKTAARAQEIAERTVGHFVGQWTSVGYGPWAVIEQSSGRLVGHAGLRLLREMNDETEILYMLDDTVWGRGYATQASIAARDLAFGPLALPRLIGMALPDNAASIRVLEKVGLRFERVVRFADLDVVYYGLDAPDAR